MAGSCTDNAGKVASAGVALNYDATPPTISRATPSRPPNNHGWYNRPVSFAFSAADATSGLSGCSNPTYTGPNTASASVTGTCLDRAGNVAARSVPLHYDASPPALGASVDTGDGFVSLHWLVGGDVAPIESLRIVANPASAATSGVSCIAAMVTGSATIASPMDITTFTRSLRSTPQTT